VTPCSPPFRRRCRSGRRNGSPVERGRIAIFNRSYYEKVLVVRVHPELLDRQKLPPPLVSKRIWDERLAGIAHFENYVARQGTKIVRRFRFKGDWLWARRGRSHA
jgi:polyphosphate kinase 2 (PPK2 family)